MPGRASGSIPGSSTEKGRRDAALFRCWSAISSGQFSCSSTAPDLRPTMASYDVLSGTTNILCDHRVSRDGRRRGVGHRLNWDASDGRTFCARAGKCDSHFNTHDRNLAGCPSPPCRRTSSTSKSAVADVDGHRADMTQFHWQPLHNRSARTHARSPAARNDRRDGRRSFEVYRSRRDRTAVDRYRCL